MTQHASSTSGEAPGHRCLVIRFRPDGHAETARYFEEVPGSFFVSKEIAHWFLSEDDRQATEVLRQAAQRFLKETVSRG